jgi:hypothetical protein
MRISDQESRLRSLLCEMGIIVYSKPPLPHTLQYNKMVALAVIYSTWEHIPHIRRRASTAVYFICLRSVADPDNFDADLDPDPTSEKNRIWIRPLKKMLIRILLYVKFCTNFL